MVTVYSAIIYQTIDSQRVGGGYFSRYNLAGVGISSEAGIVIQSPTDPLAIQNGWFVVMQIYGDKTIISSGGTLKVAPTITTVHNIINNPMSLADAVAYVAKVNSAPVKRGANSQFYKGYAQILRTVDNGYALIKYDLDGNKVNIGNFATIDPSQTDGYFTTSSTPYNYDSSLNVVKLLDFPLPNPKVVISGTIQVTKTIETDSQTNHLTGQLTALGSFNEPVTLDFHGLIPNVHIPDASVNNIVQVDQIVTTPIDKPIPVDVIFGLVSEPHTIGITNVIIDNRPSVSLSASKIYAEPTSIGTTKVIVQIPFNIDNTKSTHDTNIALSSSYLEGSYTQIYKVSGGNSLKGVFTYNFMTSGPELIGTRGIVNADSGSYHTERVIGTAVDPLKIVQNDSQIPHVDTPTTTTPTGTDNSGGITNPVSNTKLSLPIIAGIALAVGVGFVAISSGGKSRKKVTA